MSEASLEQFLRYIENTTKRCRHVDVNPETTLEDLTNGDSLAGVEVVMKVEEFFDVMLCEEFDGLVTLSSLYELGQQKSKEKQQEMNREAQKQYKAFMRLQRMKSRATPRTVIGRKIA